MLSSHTEETEQDQFQLSVSGPHDQPVPPGTDTGRLAYTPSASAAAEDLHPFPSQGHRYSRGAGQGLFDTHAYAEQAVHTDSETGRIFPQEAVSPAPAVRTLYLW